MLNPRTALTADQATPSRTQWFCNNCFKAADALHPDGQFPVCAKCLEKRRVSKMSHQAPTKTLDALT